MKNTILLLIAAAMLALQASAQDIITRSDGDQIICHILKVNSKKIKYKLAAGDDTRTHTIRRQLVAEIKYTDGHKKTLNPSYVDDKDPEGHWNKRSMAQQGRDDAKLNYRGYRGAAAGTFWTCVVTGGVLGLIPAITTSAHAPKPNHLNEPDPSLMDNDEYREAYIKKAHSIKTRKVWGNYVGGIAVNIAVIVAIIVI